MVSFEGMKQIDRQMPQVTNSGPPWRRQMVAVEAVVASSYSPADPGGAKLGIAVFADCRRSKAADHPQKRQGECPTLAAYSGDGGGPLAARAVSLESWDYKLQV